MGDILNELEWRGLIYGSTDGLAERLRNGPLTLYNGFDPSADSLGIGNLVPLMQLARFQRFGHTPIALAGGGTGMIGDPSGKATERQLLSYDQVAAYVEGIKPQLAAILDFEVKSNPAKLLNNADWLTQMSMMSFLRDVGKHLTVNYMMAKDSVKSRLDREDGISYTEFSYMLLQAYDYHYLFEHENCVLQAGGSDQWGNIIAGVELIRKARGEKAYGIVYPLITKADGTKFGKSEGGNVWLDPRRTSPYRFYQFWLNTDDAEVVNYLKIFTWLGREEILELEDAVVARPHERAAQKRLARSVTEMIHGPTALAKAEQATDVLFGGDLEGLDASDIADIFAEVPSSEVTRAALESGLSLVDLLATSTLATSKGDARRAIKGGGIYLNNRRVNDVATAVSPGDAVEGQFLVLRKGRKKYHLVRLQG